MPMRNFSGAARDANEAAGAGYSAASGGESAETGLGGGASGIRTRERLSNPPVKHRKALNLTTFVH